MLAEGIWTSCFRFRLAPPTFESQKKTQTTVAFQKHPPWGFKGSLKNLSFLMISPGRPCPCPSPWPTSHRFHRHQPYHLRWRGPNNPRIPDKKDTILPKHPQNAGQNKRRAFMKYHMVGNQCIITNPLGHIWTKRQHTTGKHNYKVNCFTTHTTQKKTFSENYVSNNCLKFPSKNAWRFCPVLSSTLSGSKSSSLAHVRSNALSIVHLSSFGSGLPNGPRQKLVAMQRPLQHIATKEQICWQNATCSWRVAPDFSQFICKSAFKRCCFRSISTKLKRPKKKHTHRIHGIGSTIKINHSCIGKYTKPHGSDEISNHPKQAPPHSIGPPGRLPCPGHMANDGEPGEIRKLQNLELLPWKSNKPHHFL